MLPFSSIPLFRHPAEFPVGESSQGLVFGAPFAGAGKLVRTNLGEHDN
jgi:hypothetical protein